MVHAKDFKNELCMLKQKERSLSKASALRSFDPFIGGKGTCRDGGQIRRLGLNKEYMDSVILPKKSKVTALIVKCCHLKAAHCGRGILLN